MSTHAVRSNQAGKQGRSLFNPSELDGRSISQTLVVLSIPRVFYLSNSIPKKFSKKSLNKMMIPCHDVSLLVAAYEQQ